MRDPWILSLWTASVPGRAIDAAASRVAAGIGAREGPAVRRREIDGITRDFSRDKSEGGSRWRDNFVCSRESSHIPVG